MQGWIEQGIREVIADVHRKGPPQAPQHLKLAPHPPEGMFAKFIAGGVLSIGYTIKDYGNPFQKPTFIYVYAGSSAPGVPLELVQLNPFDPTIDLDGTLTTGLNLTGVLPGNYRVVISAVNDYGETFCITPKQITYFVP